MEIYFYKNDDEELDDWDKSMEKLSRLLIVCDIGKRGVIVNLSQVIRNRLQELDTADLFIDCDVDSIMEDIEAIISGYVSENWMKKFVDTLAINY